MVLQGESEAALDIFDTEVSERMKSGAMLDIVDSTSLLYRLELAGMFVKHFYKLKQCNFMYMHLMSELHCCTCCNELTSVSI